MYNILIFIMLNVLIFVLNVLNIITLNLLIFILTLLNIITLNLLLYMLNLLNNTMLRLFICVEFTKQYCVKCIYLNLKFTQYYYVYLIIFVFLLNIITLNLIIFILNLFNIFTLELLIICNFKNNIMLDLLDTLNVSIMLNLWNTIFFHLPKSFQLMIQFSCNYVVINTILVIWHSNYFLFFYKKKLNQLLIGPNMLCVSVSLSLWLPESVYLYIYHHLQKNSTEVILIICPEMWSRRYPKKLNIS